MWPFTGCLEAPVSWGRKVRDGQEPTQRKESTAHLRRGNNAYAVGTENEKVEDETVVGLGAGRGEVVGSSHTGVLALHGYGLVQRITEAVEVFKLERPHNPI